MDWMPDQVVWVLELAGVYGIMFLDKTITFDSATVHPLPKRKPFGLCSHFNSLLYITLTI